LKVSYSIDQDPPSAALNYCTYFGGDCHYLNQGTTHIDELGNRVRGLIALPEAGIVVMCGRTTTVDFPTTPNSTPPVVFPNWRYGMGDGWVSIHNTN